MQKLKANRWIT